MTITINNKPVLFSTEWNDLTKPQILEMARIFLVSRRETSLTSLRIQLTTVILQFEKRFWKDLEADIKSVEGDDWEDTFNAEVFELVKVSDFFLDEKYRFYPKLKLTKNYFYKINSLYGPGDKLKNITFGEWCLMDNLYIQYATKGTGLNTLIAALWRPSKPKTARNRQRHYDGDRRVEILVHEAVLDKYVEKVARWDDALKYAIFIYIASCRKAIINKYKNLFPEKPENKIVSEDLPPVDYAMLILNLAGGKFGDDTQVFNKNANTILKYLDDLERKRIEKKTFGA